MTTSSELPNPKRIQLENSSLKSALNQSISDDLAYKMLKKFYNIDDLERKLNFLDRNYWSVVKVPETLFICSTIKSPYPKINLSLVIESDFALNEFCRDMVMNTIQVNKIPKHLTDQNNFET